MSADVHATVTAREESYESGRAFGTTLGAVALAVLSGIITLIGAIYNREQFAYSWLFAFTFFFTLSAGSLFWLLIHHATDAEWSVLQRRILETIAALLPVMILFFLPLVWCSSILWKWLALPVGADVIVDLKRGFINFPFSFVASGYDENAHSFAIWGFMTRAVIYIGALSALALAMYRHSTSQDKDGAAKHTRAMRMVGGGGLPLFCIVLTVCAADWLMGLDNHWNSTLWGVYIFAGGVGSAMCLLVVVTYWLQSLGYLKTVTIEHYHVMGKLMLAFCAFWAYIAFSQYMLVWYGNIPEETSYFIRRNIGSWCDLNWILAICRFFIPFPILLIQSLKREPRHLLMIALWMLAMQLLDLYIVVLPPLHTHGASLSILDLSSLVFIGSVLFLLFTRQLAKHNLFPLRDPRLAESIKLLN